MSLNLKIAFRILINLSEGSNNELERKNETKQSLRVYLTAKSGLGVAEHTLLPEEWLLLRKDIFNYSQPATLYP